MGNGRPILTRLIVPLRYLLWISGAIILGWSFANPEFRDAENLITGSICLPWTISLGAFILGWGITKANRKFFAWMVFALIGQGVILQTIDAGRRIHYQHYKTFEVLAAESPWLIAFLIIQFAVVIYNFINQRKPIQDWLSSRFHLWQIIILCIVIFLTSAAVSPSVGRYISELVFAAAIQLLNLCTVVFAVQAIPDEALLLWKSRFMHFYGKNDEESVGKSIVFDSFGLLCAAWVFILSATLSFFAYQRHPHIPDEVAYINQARYFAAGVISTPAPPVSEAFDVYLMQLDDDIWYPVTPPGWPSILAIGTRLGAGWLVNPLLAGINILLIYGFLASLYSRWLARISIFLLCFSPWYIFMGMNYMTHTLTLTCALIAALGIIKTRLSGNAVWTWLAGGSLGWMSMVRPLDGLITGVLLGLWGIGFGGKRLKLFSLIGLAAGALLIGSIGLVYNQLLTGDFKQFPLNAYTDQRFGPNANAFGFGPDRGMGWQIDPNPGHSPIDGIINTSLNAFSLNIELFGWSTGSLILVTLALISGSYRKSDYLMMAVILSIVGVYFFYYFSGGPDFGARYWYLTIVPLAALTVRGIEFLAREKNGTEIRDSFRSTQGLIFVLILSGMAFINYFPWRAVDKYHHYLNMRPDIRHLAEQYGFGNSLVLINGPNHPDYSSAAIYNPLDVYSNKPVYVWNQNASTREAVLYAYPEKKLWLVDGPTLTGLGYAVVAGPLTAEELLSQSASAP